MKKNTTSDPTDRPAAKDSLVNQEEAPDKTLNLSGSMMVSSLEDDQDDFSSENEPDETFSVLDATTVVDDIPPSSPSTPASAGKPGKEFESHVVMVPGGDLDAVEASEPAAPKHLTNKKDRTADNIHETGDAILPSASSPKPADHETVPFRLDEAEEEMQTGKPAASENGNFIGLNDDDQVLSPDDVDENKFSIPPELAEALLPEDDSPETRPEPDSVLELNPEMMIPEFENNDEKEEDIIDLDAPTIMMNGSVFETTPSDKTDSEEEEEDIFDLNAPTVMMDEPVFETTPPVQADSDEEDGEEDIFDLNAPTVMMDEPVLETTPSDQADSEEEDDDILDLNAPTVMMDEPVFETTPSDQADSEEEDDDILDLNASSVITDEPVLETAPSDQADSEEEDDDILDLNAPTVMMDEPALETAPSDQADSEEEDDDILDLNAPTVMMDEPVFETTPSDQADPEEDEESILDLAGSAVVKDDSAMQAASEPLEADENDDDIIDLSVTAKVVEDELSFIDLKPDQEIPASSGSQYEDTVTMPGNEDGEGPGSDKPPGADDSTQYEETVTMPVNENGEEADSGEPSEADDSTLQEETVVMSFDEDTPSETDAHPDTDTPESAAESMDDMEFKLPEDFPMPIFDEPPELDGGADEEAADDDLTMTGILDTINLTENLTADEDADDGASDTLLDMSILDADTGVFSTGDSFSLDDPPEEKPFSDTGEEETGVPDSAFTTSGENEKEALPETGPDAEIKPEDDVAAFSGHEEPLEGEEKPADEAEAALPETDPMSLAATDAAFHPQSIPVIEILPKGGDVSLPHAKTCHSSFTQDQIESSLERVIEKIFAEKIEGILRDAVEKAVAEEVKRMTGFMMIDEVEDI